MYKNYLKRVFDFSIALFAIVIASPLMITVAVWLHFANKRAGVFFLQERPGRYGKIFKVVKYKTMTDEKDSNGNLLPDEERLTPIGKFIRSTYIDELPQLINVLKGDMALIGPRPLLVKYLPLYSKKQARRHEVRPGISGWAQCHGRNAISWRQKLEYDVWYVDNISLWTDIRIIWKTIISVVQRDGISAENNVTIDDFNGYN